MHLSGTVVRLSGTALPTDSRLPCMIRLLPPLWLHFSAPTHPRDPWAPTFPLLSLLFLKRPPQVPCMLSPFPEMPCPHPLPAQFFLTLFLWEPYADPSQSGTSSVPHGPLHFFATALIPI